MSKCNTDSGSFNCHKFKGCKYIYYIKSACNYCNANHLYIKA
jgi:hypothetical protein